MSSAFLKDRLIFMLLMGLLLTGFGIQQAVTIWTPKSSLTAIKGTVKNCNTYISTVTSKGRYGVESKSQKTELIFYLHEWKKKFQLRENIGSNRRNEEFEDLKKWLLHTDSVTIWIKKSEIDAYEPKVFQIDTPRNTLLNFDEVRFKDRGVTMYLFVLGLGCCLVAVYLLRKKNGD